MSNPGRELRQALPSGPGVELAKMTVDSLRDDGTVNLSQGGAVYENVPCLNSYLDRAAGDVVTVVRWSAGWCVLGKVGAEFDAPAPAATKITWGSAAPSGSGWVTGTPWVRSGELYIQTAAGGGTSAPDAVTISPSSQGAWRDGGLDSGQTPTQGAWSSYPHPYTGAWFYGSTISAACTGLTVASMKVKLTRTSSSHGSYGAVRPLLYLLAASSAGSSTPTLGSGPELGPALGLGSSGTFTLPGSWATALAAGTAGGIGVYADVGNSYLVFTGSCGQVTINFS